MKEIVILSYYRAKELRRKLEEAETIEALKEVLGELLDELPTQEDPDAWRYR